MVRGGVLAGLSPAVWGLLVWMLSHMSAGPRSPTLSEQQLAAALVKAGACGGHQVAQAVGLLRTVGGTLPECLAQAGVATKAIQDTARALGQPVPVLSTASTAPGASAFPDTATEMDAEGSTARVHVPEVNRTRPAAVPATPLKSSPAAATVKPRAPTSSSANAAQAPEKVGPFKLLRTLGRGGMATVYLAAHEATEDRVALKVMLPHLASDPAFVQRFLKEANASRALNHPNVIKALSHGEDNGRYYMAFEFVDGGATDQLLQMVGNLPWPVVLEMGMQLLSGLEHAHGRGIIHRDLKPANLLLTRAGTLKIADFGVAKQSGTPSLTQTGAMVGTPTYLCPEMVGNARMDHRGDLYTVGVILRELLCGGNPFHSENIATTIHRIVMGGIKTVFEENPCVPPLLEYIIERLMERDPARRFPSAQAVMDALSPLHAQVEAEHPFLLVGLAEDPAATVKRLRAWEGEGYLREAQDLLKKTHVERPAAAFHLYRALRACPTHAEAANLYDLICKQEHFVFTPSADQRVYTLLKTLEDNGDTPQALQQLATLYRNEGNIHLAAGAWRRYLRVRPDDGFARNQLMMLTNALPLGLDAPPPPPASGTPVGGDVQTSGVFAPSAAATSVARPPPPQRPSASLPVTAAPLAGAGLDHGDQDSPRNSYIGLALVLLVLVGVVGRKVYLGSKEPAAARPAPAAVVAPDAPGSLDAGTAPPAAGTPATTRPLLKRVAAATRACRDEDFALCGELAAALVEDGRGTPEAGSAALLLGKARLGQEMFLPAAEALEAFVEAHPEHVDYAEGLYLMAQALNRSGDPTKATETYSRLLKEKPGSPLVDAAQVERGECYAGKNQPKDAEADFRAVVARAGPSSDAHQRAVKGLEALGLKATP